MAQIKNSNANPWRFTRLGGFDQVDLTRTADLTALPELDQKLWAALSCPTHGLSIDSKTLDLMDSDGDGRIRASEVIAAVGWAVRVLNNPDELFKKQSSLPLASINDADEDGKQLLASAKEILKNLDKAAADAIGIDDLADMTQIFANTRFNGDGIVPVKAADDEVGRLTIQDVIDCCGAETDRCGDPGITQQKVDLFFKQLQDYAAWWQLGETDAIRVFPSAEDTEAAAALFAQLKAKIDDFFTRCQLAAFDGSAAALLNPNQTHYEQLAGIDLSGERSELAVLPLAAIAAGKDLPLRDGLNPAWAQAVAAFKDKVLTPLLGEQSSLSMTQWQQVTQQFGDHQAWLAQKPENVIEGLGVARIKVLAQSDMQAVLTELIEQDLQLQPEAQAIDSVARLVHYYRDLATLLNNFVTFRDFYCAEPHGIFQAGTLYLDGRSCQLCVKVDDIDKHSHLAALSKIFLAYCQCRRQGSNEMMTIAAAFTGGDSDNLMVGRNGVFYDRNGLDWDATIVKVIENPISISQAFWAPYKRVARMINEQLEKSASARDKAAQDGAFKGVAEAGAQTGEGKAPAPFDVGKFAGIFAAIGLAIGAIGTALAAVVGGFMALTWWQMPLAIIGVMLAISGPSMFIAYLKLHQRNLAPVLDACGWAVNAKAFINIPFGRLLTGTAKLPKGSERQMRDPFGEKKTPWGWYLLVIVVAAAGVLWQKGCIPITGDKVPQGKAEQAVKPAAAQPAETKPAEPAPAKPQ